MDMLLIWDRHHCCLASFISSKRRHPTAQQIGLQIPDAFLIMTLFGDHHLCPQGVPAAWGNTSLLKTAAIQCAASHPPIFATYCAGASLAKQTYSNTHDAIP